MAAKKKIIGMDPVPPIRMANFLAPRGIDLSHYNYVVMDGLYYSFLYIKAGGYPSRVRAGWMSSLINAGEGVDIDVHLRRENRSRTIDSKLLQPQDDEMKYIFVLPNIAMVSQIMLPKAPCLFATVNFAGQEEPDITFYTEEAATDGLDKLVHSSAG